MDRIIYVVPYISVIEQNAEIFAHFYAAGKNVLGTRANQTQYEAVKQSVPGAQFDPSPDVL